MALAILKYEGDNNGIKMFTVDAGTNTFYRYAVASEAEVRNGIPGLVGEISQSEIFSAPAPSVFDSSFPLKLPASIFKRGMKYIQLITYKDKSG
ncbi:MAG: hypothetical protein EOO01_27395, partial [Chitinophagaceae bacterium]